MTGPIATRTFTASDGYTRIRTGWQDRPKDPGPRGVREDPRGRVREDRTEITKFTLTHTPE